MTRQQRIKCLRCDLMDASQRAITANERAKTMAGDWSNSDTRDFCNRALNDIFKAAELLKKAELELMFLRHAARERKGKK